MAGFRDAAVNGLALLLVGGGLAAAALSYARNIPDPAAPAARGLSDWEGPVTTGSIAPRAEDEDEPAVDPWIDPPPHAAETPPRHRS